MKARASVRFAARRRDEVENPDQVPTTNIPTKEEVAKYREDHQPTPEQRLQNLMKDLEKAGEKHDEEVRIAREKEHQRAVIWRMSYLDWNESHMKEFIREYRMTEMRGLSRSEIYNLIQTRAGQPWTSIGNCVGLNKIPKPDGFQLFTAYDIDMTYDYLIPRCGVIWKWWNDSSTDKPPVLSDDYIDLQKMFADNPIILLPKQVGEGLSDLSGPLYAVGGAVALMSIAYITSKVSK